ncbi:Ulp1-like peptidase [Cucumis melo var. makuwa]|uniref:Ulp1-like peptidase n=1 Tax=Cucumis melo var. makuwa TaxID=1194695 RepID=A0A5D3DST8_CUCMM|nr:Ulp1-like peptidase [Cucumis melo var. makuwa]
MPLVTMINSKDFFLANLTCYSHLAKIVSNIKNKLIPKLVYMFRKRIFGYFLDVKLVFNRPLCHYILLREVEDEWDNISSFKILDQKVSFGLKDFDTITGLRARPRRPIQLDDDKALRLRHLYLGDQSNMNGLELDKDYPTLNFESDKDAMKMLLYYLIELPMNGTERR